MATITLLGNMPTPASEFLYLTPRQGFNQLDWIRPENITADALHRVFLAAYMARITGGLSAEQSHIMVCVAVRALVDRVYILHRSMIDLRREELDWTPERQKMDRCLAHLTTVLFEVVSPLDGAEWTTYAVQLVWDALVVNLMWPLIGRNNYEKIPFDHKPEDYPLGPDSLEDWIECPYFTSEGEPGTLAAVLYPTHHADEIPWERQIVRLRLTPERTYDSNRTDLARWVLPAASDTEEGREMIQLRTAMNAEIAAIVIELADAAEADKPALKARLDAATFKRNTAVVRVRDARILEFLEMRQSMWTGMCNWLGPILRRLGRIMYAAHAHRPTFVEASEEVASRIGFDALRTDPSPEYIGFYRAIGEDALSDVELAEIAFRHAPASYAIAWNRQVLASAREAAQNATFVLANPLVTVESRTNDNGKRTAAHERRYDLGNGPAHHIGSFLSGPLLEGEFRKLQLDRASNASKRSKH